MRLFWIFFLIFTSCSKKGNKTVYQEYQPKIKQLTVEKKYTYPKIIIKDSFIAESDLYVERENTLSSSEFFLISTKEEDLQKIFINYYNIFKESTEVFYVNQSYVEIRSELSQQGFLTCSSDKWDVFCISEKRVNPLVKLYYDIPADMLNRDTIELLVKVKNNKTSSSKDIIVTFLPDREITLENIKELNPEFNFVKKIKNSLLIIDKSQLTDEKELFILENDFDKILNINADEDFIIDKFDDFLLIKNIENELFIIDLINKNYNKIVRLTNDFKISYKEGSLLIGDSNESYLYNIEQHSIINYLNHKILDINNVRDYNLNTNTIISDNYIFQVNGDRILEKIFIDRNNFLNIRRISENLFIITTNDFKEKLVYYDENKYEVISNIRGDELLSDKISLLKEVNSGIYIEAKDSLNFKSFYFINHESRNMVKLFDTCIYCDDDVSELVIKGDILFFKANINKDIIGNKIDKMFQFDLSTNTLKQLSDINGNLLGDNISKILRLGNDLLIVSGTSLYTYSNEQEGLIQILNDSYIIKDMLKINNELFIVYEKDNDLFLARITHHLYPL